MKTLLFLLVFVMPILSFAQTPPIEPGVSHELAKWRAARYSDVRYKLNLTLEKMSPVLKGTIEIRMQYAAVACAEPNCPPMAIVLDWRKIKGHEEKSTITNVTINGTSAAVIYADKPHLMTFIGTAATVSSDHFVISGGVKMGENVIKLDFTSPILTSGS